MNNVVRNGIAARATACLGLRVLKNSVPCSSYLRRRCSQSASLELKLPGGTFRRNGVQRCQRTARFLPQREIAESKLVSSNKERRTSCRMNVTSKAIHRLSGVILPLSLGFFSSCRVTDLVLSAHARNSRFELPKSKTSPVYHSSRHLYFLDLNYPPQTVIY